MRQNPERFWTHDEAVALAIDVEDIAPRFGAHVALTGGCLYKRGLRKDADLIIYRIRQVDKIDRAGLIKALETELGWTRTGVHGWVVKFDVRGGHVDVFFPDHVDRGPTQGEDYNGQDTDTEAVAGDDDLPF